MAAFLALALVAPVPTRAADTTGTLQGIVRDDAGTVLPGISVSVRSSALIGGERAAVTTDDGRYRFPALPVGTYTVKAAHEAFGPAESRAWLGIGSVVTVDFELRLPTDDAPLVTEIVTVVDPERTASGMTFDRRFLENVPSGRTYQGLAQFAPGVTGGANPNVHGETLYSNSYLLDGVNVTDPVTHTFTTNLNFDAIEAVEIITGGYDAEYGRTTGAAVNIVTRSGGNERSMDASAWYGDFNLVSGGKKHSGDFQNANVNLSTGGPVLRDKVWYFFSYELNRSVFKPAVRTNYNTGIATADPQVFLGHYILGKVTFAVTPAQTLTFLAQSDPTTLSNLGGDSYTFPDAQTLREQGGWNYSLAHDWTIGGSTRLHTQVAMVESILNEVSARRDFTTPTHLNTNGDQTVNNLDFYWDRRQRLEAHTKATRFLDDVAGDHEVGVGVDYAEERNAVVSGFNGDAAYVDDGYLCEDSAGPHPCGSGEFDFVYDERGNPAGAPYLKYEFTGASRSVTTGSLLGFWLQDDWKPIRNLTLKIGGRYDRSRYYNDVGTRVVDFETLAPRLSVAWDPMNDGGMLVVGGYARSYDNGSLLVPDFVNRRGVTGRIYQWDGAQYSYAGDFGASGGYALTKLRAPVRNEFQLGVSGEMARNFAMGARLILARTQHYFEDREGNVIWNADGSDAIGFRDGVDHYVFSLGTPSDAYRDYRALEITLHKALANGWFVNGSYTRGDARGTSDAPITYFADNPVQDRYRKRGELSYNVAHAIKLQATKELLKGLAVGAAYSLETGGPYDRIYYNDYYEGYFDYRNKPGRFHYPPLQRIDLRGQWAVALGRKRLTLIADVFNVLDSRTVTRRFTPYDPQAGSSQLFGRTIERQDPLRAQVAVRYNF